LRERLATREAFAILAALLLLGLGVLAWPDARDAIAHRLGLRGVTITHVPEEPTPPPTPVGVGLGLGSPVSLVQARERLGAGVVLPARLGSPDGIYAGTGSGQIWLVYAPRDGLPPMTAAGGVGLLLTEMNVSLDPNLLMGKGVPSATRLDEVQVRGNRGFWLEGAPHLFLRDATGSITDMPPRLAGNTLLWGQSGLTLRLESALPRDAAISLAETLEPQN
jgi:hypothetical protein